MLSVLSASVSFFSIFGSPDPLSFLFCLGTARYEQQFHMVQGDELGEAANQFGDRDKFLI
jgi:hypothetical protein